mgnify:CR=1 FL=1
MLAFWGPLLPQTGLVFARRWTDGGLSGWRMKDLLAHRWYLFECFAHILENRLIYVMAFDSISYEYTFVILKPSLLFSFCELSPEEHSILGFDHFAAQPAVQRSLWPAFAWNSFCLKNSGFVRSSGSFLDFGRHHKPWQFVVYYCLLVSTPISKVDPVMLLIWFP